MFWHGKPVCVTGGSGFLGYQIVRQLLDLGADVRIHTLTSREHHPIAHLPIKIHHGDIRDPASVRQAVEGCAAVFHTAGVVGVSGPAVPQMHDVHEIGTRNVLASMGPTTRLVHTSSLVAVGSAHRGRPVDEETPFNLEGVRLPYVQAKRASELLALTAANAGRDVVVVNPSYLIGPEDHARSVMGAICVRFWRGQLPLAPPGGFNLVDVRDVACGHLLAAEHGQPGRRYILGGENHSFAILLRMLASVAGMRPRAFPRFGLAGFAVMAFLAEGRARLLGKEANPSFAHLRLNRHFWYCSSDRASRELGHSARSARESLTDAFAWHREQSNLQIRGLARWWMRAQSA
jgi:dihydroflavonol-4-reductase